LFRVKNDEEAEYKEKKEKPDCILVNDA